MMKMKYQEHIQHLSAILSIAMVFIQLASSVYGALDHGALDGQQKENQSLVNNLSKDQLNNMTISQLEELNREVKHELIQKEGESLGGATQLRAGDWKSPGT